ncbi:hypothetical protein Sjap_008530 [Stephania japonica]|uniref:YqaJ viral recombinase domain-containing protein n=1 Tax=Stephania japonica TaxID=461633 RepID=A0AAP0PEJ4_9MAGN
MGTLTHKGCATLSRSPLIPFSPSFVSSPKNFSSSAAHALLNLSLYRYQKSQSCSSLSIKVQCRPSQRYLCYLGYSTKSSGVGTNSIFQASCLQHPFKNWQEERKDRLTASTFGGAIGFWPGRRVQLWLEKLGAVEPFTNNFATCWSNIKVKDALDRYELITGNNVSITKFHQYDIKNPHDSWLGCSPDGVVYRATYGLPSSGVLLIKCPFFNGEKQRSYPWSRIPLYCMPQAQGLMEISDMEWMDLYCWTLNGSSLFRLYRDQNYWELMKEALSDFWWKHVQPAKDLCSQCPVKDPRFEMKSLKPAPRHELCGDIVYFSKCLVDNSELLIREVHGKLQI